MTRVSLLLCVLDCVARLPNTLSLTTVQATICEPDQLYMVDLTVLISSYGYRCGLGES